MQLPRMELQKSGQSDQIRLQGAMVKKNIASFPKYMQSMGDRRK